MTETTKCGDRRCTIEEAELELKGYRDRYSAYRQHPRSTDIDAMPMHETRIKTELDEASELIESAKKRGADAWHELGDAVQAALDRLSKGFQSMVGGEHKG